jgi:phosphoglycolate phosphatase-like HAD superfamily hydrolase
VLKAVIFDFDGVLVESAEIKTDAFREVFSDWPGKADEGVAFHMENMGISRYVKFRHFYENVLGEQYSDEIGDQLGARFSGIVLEKVKAAPLVSGTEEFLETNHLRYHLFIASGTPQDELDDIVDSKGLRKYFKGVFGAPDVKPNIVEKIMKSYGLKPEEVVFVGDAESDRRAADANGVVFILRMTDENQNYECRHKVRDLTGLSEIIKEL